ncbi:MAG: site-specific integrase, partial [Candidatus Acidiferrales bacterium]
MASIYRREKVEGRWKYICVNLGRGRRPADAPPYYVRVTVNGKRQWSDRYETLKEAQEAAASLPDVLEAQSKNLTLDELHGLRNAHRIAVKSAVDTYLEQKAMKAPKTRLQYKRTLSEFLEALAVCKIRFLDEVTEAVLRKYKAFLEGREYAGKTIDTRLNIVYFLLKKNGVTARLPRDEMPTVEEETAVPYTDEEIKKLFAAMDEESRLRYKFFLGTGCRDKEVTFAAWNDIDFTKREYHIRRKEDVGFTPKSHESRTVPLPVSLVEALRARRKWHPEDRWIFVNERGEPDNHFLRKLKRIALHAGL